MMCRKNLIAWLLVLVMLVGMVPVQALAAETAQPRIDAQQIVLGEDLTMRFLVTIPNPDAVMKISVAGEEVGSYPVAELTPNGDGSYEFAVELAAAQMTDIVNLELTSGEEVLLSKDYSVQRYADALLAGKYSDEIKAMVRQMLSYGAAAQTYFAYNTENPVSVDMEGEAVELPAAAETEMVAEGIVEGVAFYGASLLFRSKVAVRFYFTAPNGVAGYTFTANGEPCEVLTKGELYYVEIPSVSPADYSSVIDLTVADDSSSLHVSYSPLHYMINMNNKETTGDSLKALMQAMYNYHLAAVDYIGGDSSVEYPYYPAFTTDYAADYYIGNSTVFLGSLVATSDEIAKNAVVDVTVETLSGEASAVYTDAGDVFGWANGTVAFSGNGVVKITVNGTELQLTVDNTTNDVPYLPAVTFDVKFANTDEYLYRVGNGNTVALGSLFTLASGDPTKGAVNVSVEAMDGAAVSGAYTANNSDWTKSTLQFTGTGPVKVTINDTVLLLEVVNAKNATSAASVTANNVVLLNDVSISTISVSNGYTLYGNGFTVTAPNDVLCTSVGDGFVELNNGTLDNVQIVCPNFDYSVVYQSNMKAEDNYHEGEWYGNTRSAVVVDGNSTIRNSYIHGGRAVLYVRSGHILVDNTTISGGAAANIHALSAKSLTLRDVTMIQEPNHATVHDTSVTKMGLSGLFECDSTGACTPLILEGTLIQHAWIDEGDREYVPEGLESVIGVALSKTAYLHDLDGDGTKESLNLGFTYVPQNIGDYITPNITDNRIDKSTVPYAQVDISASIAKAIVYSYQNTNGTASQFIPNENDTYAPSEQGVVAPSVSFSDTGDTRVYATSYDEVNGWSSTLTVDLDPGDYTFNFADLVAQKYGKPLSYTVAKADGTAVDAAQPIALTASSVTDYVLTITDDLIYDANGALTNESVSCTYYFTLISSKSSIPDPEAVKTDGGTPLLVVKGKNGDWSCAIPALEGITVRYYTSGSNYVDLDLATLTPSTKGRQNGTENFWEYSNGYKLKVTCGYIHESKQVYGMPVVVDNNGSYEMYFTISNTNGYVSTSTTARTVTLTYDFTDPNGKTLSFKKTWNFVYNDYKSGKQYSYNDFVVGNLTEAGGSSCFTPDTLITLADGTQKRVDELAFGDKVLSWDFFTGSYIEKNISLLVNHGAAEYDVAYTKYSDGSELKLIADHGVFDYDQNQFVYITPENVTEYVGHRFVKQNLDGGYDIVTMTEGYVAREYTEAWSVSSAVTSNVFASGLLTVAPPEDFYNWIEMDGSLHYDVEQFQQDVETYGLYTYEDFQDYVTYEQFIDWNGAYLKIPVEKGLFTFEYILELIELYKGWMPQA